MDEELVGRARKRIGEVVQHALGHRTRILVLVTLNEGPRTAAEISRIIDVPQKTLQNHLHRMLEEGSIEIEEKGETGNRTQYRYRSAMRNEYRAEEFERLNPIERQTIVGGILNSGIAELLAGFHAGKLAEPGAHVYWGLYNLDGKAREEANELIHRFLRDLRRIKNESTARTEASGEEPTSMLLKLLLFERPRKGADRPRRPAGDRPSSTPPSSISNRLCVAQRYFGWGDHPPWL